MSLIKKNLTVLFLIFFVFNQSFAEEVKIEKNKSGIFILECLTSVMMEKDHL